MSIETTAAKSTPMDFFADHLLLAAASVAGATSAGGVFIARAARSQRAKSRAVWAALASVEFAIAASLVRGVIERRRGHSLGA